MFHSQTLGRHLYPVRVYYEDTDAGGVVYHATYLRYAERARTEALRDLGVPHHALVTEHGLMFMVRRVKVDYLGPARLDDSLLVATVPLAVRAASVDLRQEVHLAGAEPEAGVKPEAGAKPGARPLVAMDIQLACVRLADGRPARLPRRWREVLEAMLAYRDHAPAGA